VRLRSGRLAAAICFTLVPSVAAGQDSPRCSGKTIYDCADDYWRKFEHASDAWLDTMHT